MKKSLQAKFSSYLIPKMRTIRNSVSDVLFDSEQDKQLFYKFMNDSSLFRNAFRNYGKGSPKIY